MLKVFFLIVEPGRTWMRTAASQRGYLFILLTYLLPFIALDVAVEGWSLMKWGKWQPRFQLNRSFSHSTVIHFESAQFVLLVAMVFVSALLIYLAMDNFHGRRNYLAAFTLAAYGYGPLFLSNLLNVNPSMNPFVSWAPGILIGVWILYQGIPQILKPDPTQAFGVYLSSIFVMFLISGMIRTITGLYLLGRVDFQNSWLLQQIGSWLGQ